MKNLFSLLTFCGMSFSLFAQSPFNEKTFNDLMAQYNKDPLQFLKTQTVSDFTFVGTNGQSMPMAGLLGLFNASAANTFEFPNVKTRQYGATAIAFSGWKHTHTLKSGVFLSYNEVLTSVFTFQEGKWMLVSWHDAPAEFVKADEEAAIKAVVERETQSFNDRDAATMTSCHANVDYAELLVRHAGGVAYSRNTKKDSPENVKALIASLGKSDGSTFKNTDYVVHINNGSAFVTYDEIVTSADGSKKELFHEVRYLEKINEKWLIVYVGGVFDPAK